MIKLTKRQEEVLRVLNKNKDMLVGEMTAKEISEVCGEVISSQTLGVLATKKLIQSKNTKPKKFIIKKQEVEMTNSENIIFETKDFAFTRKGQTCYGTGEFFYQPSIEVLKQQYFAWKGINETNLRFGVRRLNLPELVSEGLACAVFGWVRTNASNIAGLESSSCDAIDITNGETIQVKACSTIATANPGPTSFGPTTQFDKLLFMHFDCETDKVYFYYFDDDYTQLPVNRTQTIADQQREGRRPRVTMLNAIRAKGIEPFKIFDFNE